MKSFLDWLVYSSEGDHFNSVLVKRIKTRLDLITGLSNNVSIALLDKQNAESDWLYALAFATDLIQGQDPQQTSYKNKEMLIYFTKCLETKNIVKSFPSNSKIQNRKRKRKEKASPTENYVAIEDDELVNFCDYCQQSFATNKCLLKHYERQNHQAKV
jgi:hypothetical protein